MTIAVFHRLLTVDGMRDDPGSGKRHHAFDLREIDELAPAGTPSVYQGDENGGASVQSANGVAERRMAHDGWTIGVSDDAGQARTLLERRTIGAAIAINAPRAERRHRHHHQLWIYLAQHLIAEPKFRQYLDGIVVDSEVSTGEELFGKMQALRPRQIERDAPLVAVHDAEARHLLIHLFENILWPPVNAAPPVRILYRLDLDHVGAEIRQGARANRTGPPHREIDNTHALERKPIRIACLGRRRACGCIIGTGRDGLPLADRGNCSAASWRRAGQSLHGARGKAGLAADGDRYNRSARSFLFVTDEVADAGHRHDRNSSLEPFSKPLLRGALLQLRTKSAFDFFHVLEPVDAKKQRRIIAQVEQPQHLAEGTPLRRCHRGNTQPALLRSIDADGKCRPEAIDADPAHDVPAQGRLKHNVFGDRNARFENRQLAGAAVSIVHAAQHGRRRCYKAPQAGKDAGLEIGCVNRRPFDWPDQLHQSRQRPNGRVGRLKIPVWTLTAKPACFDMNKARIVSLERGKVECRTVRRIDIAAVDQDVAVDDQLRQAQ